MKLGHLLTSSIALAAMTVLGGCATSPAMREASQFGRGFGHAATAPLDDLNLRRETIPPVLISARDNPYDTRNLERCSDMAREVGHLDAALGPDLDEPAPPPGSRAARVTDAASDLALGAVRDLATDFIPGRSWIRRLTGAEQHSRAVQDAIQAGRMRRAFIKGTGMQRNCPPPASPSWFRPEPLRG